MSAGSSIEKFWYSKSRLSWLLIPFSLAIQLIALSKRFLYQIKIFKTIKNKTPLIVVGNITVGGTGKTPFISYLVSQFQTKGLSVGIVSRGYQSKVANYPHIVTESDSVIDVGDEAFMIYSNLKVPMVIGAGRSDAVKMLTENFNLDLIISDDGLQHYSMARNFEILMLDSTRFFGNKLMIPFGPLREPVSRMNTVDYIIQNGSLKNIEVDCPKTNINIPLSVMEINVINCVNLITKKVIPLPDLKKYSICAVAGIGNPQRFFNSLSMYSNLFSKKIFNDHHAFTISDFDGVTENLVIMTEKDAVKCQLFARDNWFYLQVTAGLKDDAFIELYELLKKRKIVK